MHSATTMGLATLACCTSTMEVPGEVVCEHVQIEEASDPSIVSPTLGFSAYDFAAAFGFAGDALVTYDGRLPDAVVPLSLGFVPGGPSEVFEFQPGPGYSDFDHPELCPIGESFLRVSGTAFWSLEEHLSEVRSVRFDVISLDWYTGQTLDPLPTPVEPWLTELALAELPCQDLQVSSYSSDQGPLAAGYRSVCDGGYRFGGLFIATPLRDASTP